MEPDDVLQLARSAPGRWTELELVHRSDYMDVRATLRHGELDGVRLSDGHRIHERGAPPSSWTVRLLEPYATNYEWSAMLDPYELTKGVAIADVGIDMLFGRPVLTFVARAEAEYDPICSCCPLVFSEVSQRLEHGAEWTAAPEEMPDGVELALDREVGIVVSSRDRGGRLARWFTNEILRAEAGASVRSWRCRPLADAGLLLPAAWRQVSGSSGRGHGSSGADRRRPGVGRSCCPLRSAAGRPAG